MRIILKQKDEIDDKLISPSFIYNRLDTVSENAVVLETQHLNQIYSVVAIIAETAYMGIWLMEIPEPVVLAFAEYIFSHYTIVKRIKYDYSKRSYGFSWPGIHYKISLPSAEEELSLRLSKKSRYNTKREKEIISKAFGGYTIEEYTSNNCPREIILQYFRFKNKTHFANYNMSPDDYLKHYNVSNIYVLKIGTTIGAILFSCEQFDTVYVENLTYNEDYAKYSCGKALYDIVLKRLIQKEKKCVFLGGGELEYKKKYGSEIDAVYNGYIYRNKFVEKLLICRQIIKAKIKKIMKLM